MLHSDYMISNNAIIGEPGPTHRTNRVRGVARLGLVCEGLLAGKSKRQIVRELGWDEGTVRRDVKKLSLPEEDFLAILNGDSAEKFLRAQRRRRAAEQLRLRRLRAAEEQRARLSEENENGIHSNHTAKTVLGWLLSKDLLPPDEEKILDMVDYKCWIAGDQQEPPCRDPKQAFSMCERGSLPAEMYERLNFYAAILTSAMLLLAPERTICNSAIKKARIAVCDRKRRRS